MGYFVTHFHPHKEMRNYLSERFSQVEQDQLTHFFKHGTLLKPEEDCSVAGLLSGQVLVQPTA